MPTISQLPNAVQVAAIDRVPLSQSGTAHSVSVGTLLSGTQPAILVDTGALLGRTSLGPGGPEPVSIGSGLSLDKTGLVANGQDHAAFAVQPDLETTDQLVLSSAGQPRLLNVSLLRRLFTAGDKVTISADGTISAQAEVSGVAGGGIDDLPVAFPPSAEDLLEIRQAGTSHAISYAALLDGQTIDLAQPAAPAQDSDALWVGQGSSTMARQSLAAIWAWVVTKLPGVKRPVLELTVDTALDTTVHNGHVLICSQPITLQAIPANMGTGFSCDIINMGGGSVTLSGPVLTSSGTPVLAPGQMAALRCASYSGGMIVFASFSNGGGTVTPPGEVTGFAGSSCTPTSVGLTWTPVPGAADYLIEYRIQGAANWTIATSNTGSPPYSVTGLQPNSMYEFGILAVNAGGSSASLTVTTFSTAPPLAPPGQVTGLAVTNATSNALSLTWSAPTTGGPVTYYTVQFRSSGSQSWTGHISQVDGAQCTIADLVPNASYDLQVAALNDAGAGVASEILIATTAPATGDVTAVSWNIVPSGSYTHGVGAVAANAHITPSTAAVQFGLSTSTSVLPETWVAANFVNTDLWGAYLATPATPGTWFVWVSGTDGSSPTVYPIGFMVT